MKKNLVSPLAALLLFSPTAFAQSASGTIKTIQSYEGHTGILIRLSVTMPNPDNCGSAAWYILPDSSSRVAIEQSLLLIAYARRDPVSIHISGCYENYPKIRVITVETN